MALALPAPRFMPGGCRLRRWWQLPSRSLPDCFWQRLAEEKTFLLEVEVDRGLRLNKKDSTLPHTSEKRDIKIIHNVTCVAPRCQRSLPINIQNQTGRPHRFYVLLEPDFDRAATDPKRGFPQFQKGSQHLFVETLVNLPASFNPTC